MNRIGQCLILSFAFLAITTWGHAGEQQAPGNLLARCDRVRLEIISGRIQLTTVRLGRRAEITSNDPKSDARERLLVSAKSIDATTLRYQYTDQRQQLLVDIDQTADVTIDQQGRGKSDIPTVRLHQPHGGDVALFVEDGEITREVVCASIWHLMLDEPELCTVYLVPILQSLRPNWLLDEQARRIETALLNEARRGHLPNTAKMTQLVQQLKAHEFSHRQAADRELRQMGQAVAGFLDRLDEQSLNVEQRTRIRRIRESLKTHAGDTPARVALWLADDRDVWLALLDRKDVRTRQLAAQHLGAIIGEPLVFTPEAPVAARRAQLHRLRARLGFEHPVIASGPAGRLNR